MKKLLIVFHPNYNNSQHVRSWVNEIKKNAKQTDIYISNLLGDFNIDEEQKRLLKYDVITFAFPLWWYSFPWTMKKWIDQIMTPGFAFSFNNKLEDFKLRGKKFSFIVSVGNIEETYQLNAGNKHAIKDYFNILDGLTHLLSSAWTVAGQKILNQKDYFIDPIIVYGGAMPDNKSNLEKKAKKVAQKYLEKIDSL